MDSEYLNTLNEYINGDKEIAFQMFCEDASAANLTFAQFCIAFDKLAKKHQENVEATRRHSQIDWD